MKKKDGTHTPARPIIQSRIDPSDLKALETAVSLGLFASVSDQIRPGIKRAANKARLMARQSQTTQQAAE